MLYFENKFEPFLSSKGMAIDPSPVILKDNTSGFCLSDEWEAEVIHRSIPYIKVDNSEKKSVPII